MLQHFNGQTPFSINVQIPLSDAIIFIIESFSKQSPQAGSLALSYLSLSNNRESSKNLGHVYFESAAVVSLYFRRKAAEMVDGTILEVFISRYAFLIHIMNVLLKDLRIQMRYAFEKDDRVNTGVTKKDNVRELFKKITPVGLCESDEENLLKVFTGPSDTFDYKKFLELLNAADELKPAECMIPVFSVFYAMLRGIIENSNRMKASLPDELQQKLEVDKLPKGYREYERF